MQMTWEEQTDGRIHHQDTRCVGRLEGLEYERREESACLLSVSHHDSAVGFSVGVHDVCMS